MPKKDLSSFARKAHNVPVARQNFIDQAGGIFQSSVGYDHWKSADKWSNFWSFFFDTNHGWVQSVYGSIPIDELYQKQRHSIEHIIPKTFLKEYLKKKGVPDSIRRGATVNPFNFAAAERRLNAGRSNFPFDMEDNTVSRPFRINLNPDAYMTTGLNEEKKEWIIPSRTKGDIARAILYMLLIYSIDELYTQHIETLVHWAKIDPPTAWELAYNEWVKGRLGINNPFIADAEKSRELLDNVELMNSLMLKEK
ncbi:endonuclease [Desulfogranum japonicum]|uniref:endonuclease n=1 Tax=Desulfogranum japonicum TaxID=231447 RepID=UPI00042A58E2|nr:endonuclease [Desulfogranum japonicum]